MRTRRPDKPHSARPMLNLGVLTATLLAVATMLAGCDPATRYRILSFFFDGVPVPEGVTPRESYLEPTGEGGEGGEGAGAGPSTAPASQPAPPPPTYYHAPFYKRQCNGCHSTSAGSFDRPADKTTCRKCHGRHYTLRWDDWVHGPVAQGLCRLCHEAHKSQYRHLLTKPMPELCFFCHNASRVQSRPYHVAAAGRICTDCHDPHSAGNRLLLADSTTYARRFRPVLPSPHATWKKKDCQTCHSAGASNALLGRKQVHKACLSCHEKVLKVDDPNSLHEAVRKGQCIDCHTPHKSSLPHLIRPVAEKACFACHKPEEIQKDAHPKITRGACLLCHAGHSSKRKHLLRSYDVPAPETRPASGETPAKPEDDRP